MTTLTHGQEALEGNHIEAIESWTCRFPLSKPIVLEDFEIRSREYVIVRVTTTTGLQGVSWALTRNAPIARVIENLVAPIAIGSDAHSIPAIHEKLERQMTLLGRAGLVQRAISLVDIALWDIKAQAANMPVWRLLGGSSDQARAMLVDAYPGPDNPIDTLVDTIAARVKEGYLAIKIHTFRDPAATASLLESVRDAVGPSVEIVVDVAMSWRDQREGIRATRLWAPYDPAWIEDPFRGEHFELIRELRQQSAVPVGAGGNEPLNRERVGHLVAGAVDVVRLDATSDGGLTGLASLAGLARAFGCGISTHTYPEIHQHCAFGLPGVPHVELFAPQSPYDCTERFLKPKSLVRANGGVVRPPRAPGLGVEIDWEAVEANSAEERQVLGSSS